MPPSKPPYLGAAYYPEDWPLEQIDADIALMKEAGMNVMRIGEFAWSRMEPQEERYDFSWLHLVADKLGKAGISTILGTPTATPPAWLSERYPEMLPVGDTGIRMQHGGRRHFCPNSPVYRDHCARIVTRMAEEFGRDDNVIGWQLDNELSHIGVRGCCCKVCARKFQDAMRARFGTIAELNRAWGTDLWSQTYQSFAQLPIPRSTEWHHPSLITAWMDFQSDSIVEYAHVQADILHRLTRQPVGTDMMPTHAVSYHKMNRKLDVVQFNHYNMPDNLWQAAFWMDQCRPLKPVPWWNTETSTCWSGRTVASGYREPGFCRANSWLPIALGAEANLYWLWRAHWTGHEMMHGSVVSSAGRPLHIFDEVKEIAKGYALAADFINGTRPTQAGLAMHASTFEEWLFEFQRFVEGFSYHTRISEFYRVMQRAQLRVDVIDPAEPLEAYRMICSPFLAALDEAGLRERIRAWIESGGVWLVGPLSDVRDMCGAKFPNAPYGGLEEWVGVRCKYEIPGHPRQFSLRWADGRESQGSVWYDCLELQGAEALATYTEGPMKGLAAVARRKVGKGQIVLLGTLATPEDLQRLLLSLGKDAAVLPVAEASPNLLVVPREGKAGQGLIVAELENAPAALTLPRAATDLLTGERRSGRIAVKPYGVMVLKY